jgi:hypothetical protein
MVCLRNICINTLHERDDDDDDDDNNNNLFETYLERTTVQQVTK